MPIPMLENLHKDSKIPMKKLEAYWDRAKKLAEKYQDKTGADYWKYTTSIFKNMVGTSAELPNVSESGRKDTRKKIEVARKKRIEANKGKAKVKPVEESEWWKSRTQAFKKKYLQDHPDSKYAKSVNRRRKQLAEQRGVKEEDISLDELTKTPNTAAPTTDTKPVEHDKSDAPKEQKAETAETATEPTKEETATESPAEEPAADDEQPKSKKAADPDGEKFDKHKRFRMRHMAIKAWRAKRMKVHGIVRHHKQGFSAIHKFLGGRTLSAVEMQRAKNTASLTGKLIVGALVGIALFSPLAPFAAQMGQAFMSDIFGKAESADNEELSVKETDEVALDFADQMHAWLIHQDIPALVQRLQEQAEESTTDGTEEELA